MPTPRHLLIEYSWSAHNGWRHADRYVSVGNPLRAEFRLYGGHDGLLISCRKTSQICSLSGRTAVLWSKLCQLLWCACDLSSDLLSYLANKSGVTQWHIPQQQTYLTGLLPDQCGQYFFQTISKKLYPHW